MGSCWMGDHIKSSKASSWVGGKKKKKRRIPLNHLFICLSIVPNWVLIQLTFTYRLTCLAPLARAQFLVKLGGFRLTYFFLAISFFLSSHNLLLLPHASCDFDQTWSEWPVGEWLQKLSTVWPQRSCRGHRGQKGHFYGKCYSSYMLYWILKKLGQKHQWISGYKSYQQFDLKGHVEVTGVKKVTNFQNALIELKF